MSFKTLEMQSQKPQSPLPPARDLSLGPPPRWIAPPRKKSWLRACDFEAYRAPQKKCLLTPFHSNDFKCRWIGLQKIGQMYVQSNLDPQTVFPCLQSQGKAPWENSPTSPACSQISGSTTAPGTLKSTANTTARLLRKHEL